MKNVVGSRGISQAVRGAVRPSCFGAVLISFLAAAWTFSQEAQQKPGVPPGQRKRIEALKTTASVTVVPSLFFVWEGYSGNHRTESVGGFLELAGMKTIVVGEAAFKPAAKLELPQLAEAFGEFVRRNPIGTDCALYVEFTGDTNKLALQDMKAVVVDMNGALVWSDHQTAKDEAFKRFKAERVSDGQAWQPDNMSLLLVERLSPLFGLSEKTRKASQPKSVWALLDKARVSVKAKKYEEAREVYQKVASIDPSHGEAWLGLIGALDRLSRQQEAKAVMSKWIQLQPDSVAPWEFRFLTAGLAGHHKEAVEALDHLIALRPGEGSYQMARGQELECLNRRDEAVQEYVKAATLKSAEHDIEGGAFNAAAELLRAKGLYGEAVACCTKAIELDPKNPQPVYRRAMAYAQSGDAANALADLRKAIAIEPRSKTAARQDAAFRGLQDNAEFKELMK